MDYRCIQRKSLHTWDGSPDNHDFAAKFSWSSWILPSFYLELRKYISLIACIVFQKRSFQVEWGDSVCIFDAEREDMNSAGSSIPKFQWTVYRGDGFFRKGSWSRIGLEDGWRMRTPDLFLYWYNNIRREKLLDLRKRSLGSHFWTSRIPRLSAFGRAFYGFHRPQGSAVCVSEMRRTWMTSKVDGIPLRVQLQGEVPKGVWKRRRRLLFEKVRRTKVRVSVRWGRARWICFKKGRIWWAVDRRRYEGNLVPFFGTLYLERW